MTVFILGIIVGVSGSLLCFLITGLMISNKKPRGLSEQELKDLERMRAEN